MNAQTSRVEVGKELEELRKRVLDPRVRWHGAPWETTDGWHVIASFGLRVVVGIDREGYPRYEDGIEVEIRIPHGYPVQRPEFRVSSGEGVPFHPYVDPDHGVWSSGHLAAPPAELSGWIDAFLTSICFADHPPLEHAWISNPQAADWYLASVRSEAGRFPTDRLEAFRHLKRKNFHVLSSPASSTPSMDGRVGAKTFKILNVTERYRPAERPVPKDLFLAGGIRARTSRESRHFLTFQPAATQRLFEHIGWGERTARNVVEQGGILLGHVYRDPERRFTYGLVHDVVAGSSARSSSTYLELGTDVWKQMLDQVDDRLDREGNPLRIIGWYHTHPNSLDVFMSGTDRSTQLRFFPEDWQFAVVLNPHREAFQVFHGADAAPCNGNLLLEPVPQTDQGRDERIERPTALPSISAPAEAEDPGAEPETASRGAGWRRAARYLALPLAALLAIGFAVFFYPFRSLPKESGAAGPQETKVQNVLRVPEGGQPVYLFRDESGESSDRRILLAPGDEVELIDGEREGYDHVRVTVEGWMKRGSLVPVGGKRQAGGPSRRPKPAPSENSR